MNLRESLRLGPGARLALVGAGGKTTALFQLARSFDPPVVVTATTHLGEWQAAFADRHLQISRPEEIEANAGQIEGVTLISGPASADQRLKGLDGDLLEAVRALAERLGFPILLEADGARQKSLKAPGPREPVIPPWIENVVVVAGLTGVGRSLSEETVHRVELFSALSGIAPGSIVDLDGVVCVLSHPEGGLKGIPPKARKAALLNQAGSQDLAEAARATAAKLAPPYDACVVAALADQRVWSVTEPVTGILLAAGGASRFGEPKVLLPWRGKPLIRTVAESALAGGLTELIVVTGAADAEIRESLEGLPARIVTNRDWQAGQSTSLRAGLEAAAPNCGAALFLLADQPFAVPALIQALLREHQTTLAPVIAPRVEGRRANPVLFDRVTFPDLLAIEGDVGGRAIMERYPVRFLDWHDPALLLDIDTQDDYERLRSLE